MPQVVLSRNAERFLAAYSYFFQDAHFYPGPDGEADQDERFRIKYNKRALFGTRNGSAWVHLSASTRQELLDHDFLQMISSGDHFVTKEGWAYIRTQIVGLEDTDDEGCGERLA